MHRAASTRGEDQQPCDKQAGCAALQPYWSDRQITRQGRGRASFGAAWRAAYRPRSPPRPHRFVDVWVQLEGALAEGLFDVVHAGRARDAQQIIGITSRHYQPLAWALAAAAAGERWGGWRPARRVQLRSSVLPASSDQEQQGGGDGRAGSPKPPWLLAARQRRSHDTSATHRRAWGRSRACWPARASEPTQDIANRLPKGLQRPGLIEAS